MAPARVLVGVIGAPHGVRGELRVKSYTEDPLALARYSPLETEDGARSFRVAAARLLKDDMVVMRLDGVDGRDAAAALTHTRLYVPRERLPAPEDDAFYQADLIGLSVEDMAGTPIGRVVAIVDFGAGDILEIAPPSGGARIHLPFTRAFVPEIDIAGRRIRAAPPEGLLEP